MTKVIVTGLLLAVLGMGVQPGRAQQAQWSRWYFGSQAALRFTPDSAVVLADSRMKSAAAAASVSDSAGRLLLYSNGRRVWNGNHQLLINGSGIGGDSLSSQGCALVPNPRHRGLYYLFTLDAWFTPQRRGFRVAEVDIRAAAGRGTVLSTNQSVVPDSLLRRLGNRDFMELQALVRHSNGRDNWVVTHLLDTNLFISVLVNGAPFTRASVVVSSAGTVQTLSGNTTSLPNAPGSLAVSADGRRLGLVSQILGAEVFDFDPATGRVSNPIRLVGGVYTAGVAFSPSGSLVYVSRQGPASNPLCSLNAITEVRQFDLRLPSPAAIAASALVVYVGCGRQVWGLQRAPDGRIYVANLPGGATPPVGQLDVIRTPDVRGTGCQYMPAALDLGPNRTVSRHFPVVLNEPPRPRLQALQVPAAGVCAGQPVSFTLAGSTLGASGDTLDWTFGDGTSLRTVLPGATHRYAAPGTFVVTVRLRNRPLGAAEQLVRSVVVAPRPVLSLGPDLRLCTGTAVLSVGSLPAGSTVRWHDGSTANAHAVPAAGLYWAEVTSVAGCTARDSVVVTGALVPPVVLAANEPLCTGGTVLLNLGPQPVGTAYRWQDGSTEPRLVAAAPGRYSVTVTTPDGCATQVSLALAYGAACVAQIPNIFTPNGDGHNDTFAPQGLPDPMAWSLTVFNRWGRRVFEQPAYDGKWNAPAESNGTYYYFLYNGQTGQRYKGWVEVRR